jgi:hypothetical protein
MVRVRQAADVTIAGVGLISIKASGAPSANMSSSATGGLAVKHIVSAFSGPGIASLTESWATERSPSISLDELGLAAIPICADSCGDALIALRSALSAASFPAPARAKPTLAAAAAPGMERAISAFDF